MRLFALAFALVAAFAVMLAPCPAMAAEDSETLLERVGADGTVLQARALNDYAVEIPISDCERYPVILALTRDGERLSRRDMGPIWIVYPRDDFPELQLETINARWIWQLTKLEVR